MKWYWIAIIVGAIAPIFIDVKTIRIALEERGLSEAIGVWLGMCWITVPFMLLFIGIIVWIT